MGQDHYDQREAIHDAGKLGNPLIAVGHHSFTPHKQLEPNIEQIIKEAFFLGFMISREGFNGECAFEHKVPQELKADGCTEEKLRQYIEEMEDFKHLRKLAVERLL